MTHPTRTNLLILKEKARSISSSIGILRSRRQALIKEFINTTMPFLKSREGIRDAYEKAIEELRLSLGREGRDCIESITHVTKRDMGVEITEKSIWGLKYKDVATHESPVRRPDERGYDYVSTTPHLEESIYRFEKILESIIEIANFESKLKRLGNEILKTTRKIKVLEERVLPDLSHQIKTISQYISEREREAYYRLKRFKNIIIRRSYSIGRTMAVICLMVALALFSCTSSNRMEGYVYYRLSANPTTLDPALIVDVAGGSIAAKLFNGLVRIDEQLNIAPDIAENWTISKDGLTYRFRIRQDIKYHNNQEVKANDFKYSFKRILNSKTRSPNTWVFEKIEGADDYMKGRSGDVRGIKVIDDYTLEIKLDRPFSPFLYLLTMPPAYVVPEAEVNRLGADFSSRPVGTGPFILKEWLQNRELRLERRDDYSGKKAEVRGIIYRVIAEDLTAVTEFELGNIDVLAIPASELSSFRKDRKWEGLISSINGINTYYLGMNCSRPPFDNPHVRKAVSYAIDREKLLNTFYEKRGRLASGPVPDLLRKWEAPSLYEYNPEKAKEIIKKQGLAGTTVNLYITADQEVVDMAEFIQSYMKKTGLNVKIKQLEWSAYKEAVNKGEPDMFWLSWWADYPDPENFLYPLFHSSNIGPAGNRARYSNPEFDALVEQCRFTISEKEKSSCYEKAERIIVSDAPWVFFWHKTDFMLRQPGIKDFKVYPIYSMDKGTEIKF